MEKPTEAYYMAFLPTFAFIMGYALLVGAAFVAVLVLGGHQLTVVAILCGCASGLVVATVLTLVAIACYPVYLGPAGIRSFNFWGMYTTAAWHEVASTRRLNFSGLRFLIVQTTGGARLWVPLFLSRQVLFRDTVRLNAGADNPLTRALDGGAKSPTA
jgi:hypothetical protein